jgi:PAS domain S-box-containing protein
MARGGPLKRRDYSKGPGRKGVAGGKYLPETITGIYLLSGILWMILAVTFVRHDWRLVIEDSVYVACTAVLLYILLRWGVRKLQAKESALRESEDRLARILETNASGIVVFDEGGTISYVNNAASVILGAARAKLLGLRSDDPSWELTDGDGAPLGPEDDPVAQVRRSGMPVYDVEIGTVRRDGRRVSLMVNAAPLIDASGRMVGIVASFADITERKRAEELKVRKLLLAMDQSPSAIVITDLDGNVEYANPRYFSMTGCTVQEFIRGSSPHPCRIPAEKLEEVRAAIRSERHWRGEFACRREDGEEYWEATTVTPFRSPGGETGNLLWVREDITDRKVAEEALRRSEANYRAVVEDQTEFICRFRPDGTLTFVNDAFCRYFGKAREELAGSSLLEHLQEPESVQMARKNASRDRNFPPIEYEVQAMVPGGEIRWQRWIERAVFDAAGGFIEFQAVGSDVTTHRQADIALEESQEKFRNLVETISDWVWEVDHRGVYTYVSPKVRDLLGYEPEEVIGKTPFDFMPSSEAARVGKIFGEVVARREPFAGLENVCRHKGGRNVMVETSGAPFFDADGTFRGYRGVDRDIGERKQAEEMLRASEERFRQLFEQNEEPLFLFRHGTSEIIDANPAAVDLYGYPRRELLQKGLALFVPEADKEKFSNAIAGIRPDAPLVIEKASHLRKNGEEIIVSIRAKSIRTQDGHVAYCSFRDITGRIRMEKEAMLQQAQIIHANRMASLGAIVSGVAHEVNNPNNLVMFNAPLILSAWEDALPVLDSYRRENGDFQLGGIPYSEMRDVLPKLAAGISDASQRIKGIVGNLKDFARPEDPRGENPGQINDVVRSAVMLLNHEIMKGTNRFEMDLGKDLPPVIGSEQQLEQVVINLIQNALQALSSKGQGVCVRTMRDPATGDVEVHVVDEGIGMSREVLERITEPFFSTRLDNGGLGLGLSICQSIVKRHGGVLRFESEVGKGTHAIVRFPADRFPAAEGTEPPSPKIPVRR